jgi:hypothetical protein
MAVTQERTTMSELWDQIDEFPQYSVSTHGRVMNDLTNRLMIHTPVQYGIPTVGLTRDGRQHRRSVPLLVANAWLPYPQRDDFNTVIQLDGVRANCHVDNLMWRPRWFAIEFHKERIANPFPNWDRPIKLMETGEEFDTPSDCATYYGLLEKEIFLAILNKTAVFPEWFHFRYVS